MDRGGIAERRAELLSGLTGAVVELGCGNGLNFAHYPETVTRVLAVEPDPYLRALAEQAAAQVKTPIDVVDAVAEHIPAGDGTFDAAVASLMLCSVPDQHTALREVHRVLKPGGQLRFLEHVRATSPGSPAYNGPWTPRCGRASSGAATPDVTPRRRSVRPGSLSRGPTASTSRRAGCRNRPSRT